VKEQYWYRVIQKKGAEIALQHQGDAIKSSEKKRKGDLNWAESGMKNEGSYVAHGAESGVTHPVGEGKKKLGGGS